MSDEGHVNRRDVLTFLGIFGAATAGLVPKSAKARLRPPGARPEDEFAERCVRCFRCVEVCPPACVLLDRSPLPLLSDLPHLVANDRGCTLCMRCTEVCPTGALLPIAADPATVLAEVRMGSVVLDKVACLPWARRGVCRLCWYACPYPDVAVTLDGPNLGPRFETACVGCGLCAEACPTEVKAIRIVPAGSKA